MFIRVRRRKGRRYHHNGQIQILDKGDCVLIHATIYLGIGERVVEAGEGWEGEKRRMMNRVRASGILYAADQARRNWRRAVSGCRGGHFQRRFGRQLKLRALAEVEG